jgi:hypothetical protein
LREYGCQETLKRNAVSGAGYLFVEVDSGSMVIIELLPFDELLLLRQICLQQNQLSVSRVFRGKPSSHAFQCLSSDVDIQYSIGIVFDQVHPESRRYDVLAVVGEDDAAVVRQGGEPYSPGRDHI